MDGVCHRLETRESDMLSEWIYAGQIFAQERFVHHRDFPCIIDISFAKAASLLELNSQYPEILLTYLLKRGWPLFLVRFPVISMLVSA